MSTLLALSLLLPVLLAGCATTPSPTQDPRVVSTLTALDHQFDESFGWWGRVYDPRSGGCFYSLSAKQAAATDPRFGPDIESLNKLVDVLDWTGCLDEARGVQATRDRLPPAAPGSPLGLLPGSREIVEGI